MPNTIPDNLAEKLVAVLTAQRNLYTQLATLAVQQSGYVATGESEALMSVLGARQRLVDQLTPLDLALQPFKGRWQETLDGLAANDRSAVAGLLQEVQQLLAQILERDEADKEALIRQKTNVGLQIQGAVTGRQLNKAYGARPHNPVGGLQG